jgi:hypothetical protein
MNTEVADVTPVYNIPVIQKFQIFVVAHFRLATGEINIV